MCVKVGEDIIQIYTKLLDRLHLRCKRLSHGIAGSTEGFADSRDRVLHPLSGFGPGLSHLGRCVVPELLNSLTSALDSSAKVLTDGLADRENRIRESLDLLRPLGSDSISELGHVLKEPRPKPTEGRLNLLHRTAGSRSETEDRAKDVRHCVAEGLEDVMCRLLDRLDEFTERLEHGLDNDLESIEDRSDRDVRNCVHPVSKLLELVDNPVEDLGQASENVRSAKHLSKPIAEDGDNIPDLRCDKDHRLDEDSSEDHADLECGHANLDNRRSEPNEDLQNWREQFACHFEYLAEVIGKVVRHHQPLGDRVTEVVREIVQSLAGVALESTEEAFADRLERLGDSSPEFTETIPPFLPTAEFVPAVEDTLKSIEESSDASIHHVRHSSPHGTGTLEVAEDGSEDGSPSRTESFSSRVDQLRESLNLRCSVVSGLGELHDFISLLLRVAGAEQLFTRQVTSVLGQSLDHDLRGKPSILKRVTERPRLVDHLVDFDAVGACRSLQGFLELLTTHTGVNDRVPVLKFYRACRKRLRQLVHCRCGLLRSGARHCGDVRQTLNRGDRILQPDTRRCEHTNIACHLGERVDGSVRVSVQFVESCVDRRSGLALAERVRLNSLNRVKLVLVFSETVQDRAERERGKHRSAGYKSLGCDVTHGHGSSTREHGKISRRNLCCRTNISCSGCCSRRIVNDGRVDVLDTVRDAPHLLGSILSCLSNIIESVSRLLEVHSRLQSIDIMENAVNTACELRIVELQGDDLILNTLTH